MLKSKPKLQLLLVASILLLIFGIGLTLQFRFGTVSEQAAKKDLDKLIGQITPLPDAVLIGQTSSLRPEIAGDYITYKSDASFEEIQQHYDKEFQRLGFRRYKEFGPILGEHSLFYCNANFDAAIDYYEGSTRKFTYRLSLSWERGLTFTFGGVRQQSGCDTRVTPNP